MSQTTVTKTIRFEAAHVLSDYAGLCRNLHGHSYRVDVSVTGSDSADMVVDFKELKRALEETITSRFDHAFVYNAQSEVERDIAAVVERHGLRTVRLEGRSTSENLARLFFEELRPRFSGLTRVCVWETAENCAAHGI